MSILKKYCFFFEPKKIQFENLKREKCIFDITCMFDSDNGQGGAALSIKSMDKLSKFGLNLVFDVYASCE